MRPARSRSAPAERTIGRTRPSTTPSARATISGPMTTAGPKSPSAPPPSGWPASRPSGSSRWTTPPSKSACHKGPCRCGSAISRRTTALRSTRRTARSLCSGPARMSWTWTRPATPRSSRCAGARLRSPPRGPRSPSDRIRPPRSSAPTGPPTTCTTRSGRTNGRTGAPAGTVAPTTPAPRLTCLARCPGTRTWTTTARGM